MVGGDRAVTSLSTESAIDSVDLDKVDPDDVCHLYWSSGLSTCCGIPLEEVPYEPHLDTGLGEPEYQDGVTVCGNCHRPICQRCIDA